MSYLEGPYGECGNVVNSSKKAVELCLLVQVETVLSTVKSWLNLLGQYGECGKAVYSCMYLSIQVARFQLNFLGQQYWN